jgi:hypothetical protein
MFTKVGTAMTSTDNTCKLRRVPRELHDFISGTGAAKKSVPLAKKMSKQSQKMVDESKDCHRFLTS